MVAAGGVVGDAQVADPAAAYRCKPDLAQVGVGHRRVGLLTQKATHIDGGRVALAHRFAGKGDAGRGTYGEAALILIPAVGFARALAGVLTAGTDGEQVHAILREGVVRPLVGSALEQGFALAALQQQGGGAFGHALGQYQFGAGGGNGLVQCLDGGAGAQIQLPPDHSTQNGHRPLVAHRLVQRLTGQGDGLFGQVFFGDVVIQKGEAASNNRPGEQNDHEQPQEQSFHPAASFSGSR